MKYASRNVGIDWRPNASREGISHRSRLGSSHSSSYGITISALQWTSDHPRTPQTTADAVSSAFAATRGEKVPQTILPGFILQMAKFNKPANIVQTR
jgi:hypothetical protein